MQFIQTHSYLLNKGLRVDTIEPPFTYSSEIDEQLYESRRYHTPFFNINSRKRRGLDVFRLDDNLFLETRPPVYGLDGCINIPITKNYNLFHKKFHFKDDKYIFNSLLPCTKVEKDLIFIGEVENGDSYGHFTQQIVPLIKKVQTIYSNLNVMLPYPRYSWYEELLDFFEIDKTRLRFMKIPRDAHVMANNTLYCEMMDLVSGYFEAHRYCQTRRVSKDYSASLIYFKRTKYSRTVNEEEISEFIENEGGMVIDPLKLSINEAHSVLRNTECIILEFGASITNLIHCKEGTKVIILLPEAIINPELNKKAEVFVNATYEGLAPILFKFNVTIIPGIYEAGTSKYSWESGVTMEGEERIKCLYRLEEIRGALKST